MTQRILLAIGASICLVGCIPTDFEDLRAQGQIITLTPPEGYPNRGFGELVVGYHGTFAGSPASRIAGSAGSDTPFTSYALVTSEEVRIPDTAISGCNDERPCDPGYGASLIGMESYGGRAMCIGSASFDTGVIHIRCEEDSSRIDAPRGPGGERLGFSAAALDDHPLARAILGAPSAGGSGGVYRLPDDAGAAPIALDLSGGMGASVSGIGSAVAIAALDADTALLAVGAPDGATHRVMVIGATITAGTVTTEVHACLDDPSEGWAGAVALDDLNGDAIPDLVIGSRPAVAISPERLNAVRVYDGAALPAAGSCTGNDWPVALEIACPDLEDIACGLQFGVSMATGDLDGDGFRDLIVGDPTADVLEVGGAGAMFVFRGSASIGALADDPVPLRHSSPATGAALGTAIATAPGLDDMGVERDEVGAGAPGVDRIYVFLCSPLAGDQPADFPSMRCVPRE